jgi:two-component system cell cycle sensor histidine kinase/response regulator CckA
VLIVEDGPMVHQLSEKVLEGAGYSLLGALDGQSAVNLYRSKSDSIDLVLLDLSMPKMDGEEVYRELITVRPDVRVVLSSGFTEQEIKARSDEHQAKEAPA